MTGTEGVNSFVFRGPTGTSHQPIATRNPHFWNDKSGSYKFVLRDRQEDVRSQLVTPGVFGEYETGDYFNDRYPPEEPGDAKDAGVESRQW